jgi:predicted dienelactone hydrolase
MSTLGRLVIPALLSLASALSAARAASAEAPAASPALEYEVDSFEWHDAKRDRTIPAKVFAPVGSAAAGKRPTIVFSHGYGESRD